MADQGSEVARAFVRIGGDDTDLKRDLDKSKGGLLSWLGGIGGSVKKAIGGLGSVFGGVLGGLGLGGGALQLKEWISGAMEAESATARFNALLQGAGDKAGYTTQNLGALAESIAKTTSFTKGQAMAAEQTLLLFDQISPKNFEATMKAASNLAAVLDTDLAEAARTLGMAMQDPERGLRGLRQVGITFSKDQKENLKKMVESGDIAGAQEVILDRMKKLGPAAEAMLNTTSGALKKMQKEWMGLGKGVGSALLPAIRALVGEVSGFVSGLKAPFMMLAQFISANKEGLVQIAKWVGIGAGVIASLFALKAAFAGVAAVIGLVISPVGILIGLLGGAALIAINQFGLSWKDVTSILLTTVTNLPLVGEMFVLQIQIMLEALDEFFNLKPGELQKTFWLIGKVIGGILDMIIEKIGKSIEGLKEMYDWALRASKGQDRKDVEQGKDIAKRAAAAETRMRMDQAQHLVGGGIGQVALQQANRAAVAAAVEQLPMPKEAVEEGRNLGAKMDALKKVFAERRADLDRQLAGKPLGGPLEKAAALLGGGLGLAALGAMPAQGNAPPAAKPLKFSFVGLTDAWKKMQESITGGPMMDLARKQLDVGGKQLDKLEEIRKFLEKRGIEMGGNDAVVAEG